MKLIIATTNPGKMAEMTPLLAPATGCLGLECEPMPASAPVPAEDRPTFVGNAALKAFAAAVATGLPALAEDSGLEVVALGGQPGVASARWSGAGPEANNRLLLEKLAGLAEGQRAATFKTVAVLKVPGGPVFVAEGRTQGHILDTPRGGGGFGYDPVFLSRELGRSFGEVSREEKGRVSHRSRALRTLRGYLFEAYGGPSRERSAGGSGDLPNHAWCVEALERFGCPDGLIEHQLAVARAAREAALLLREAGVELDPLLVADAGLLHDVGKGLLASGLVDPRDATCLGARPPEGVTTHAWYSAAWVTERGLDPRLARVVLTHGLDSLVSPVYCPRTWEERLIVLVDKMVERGFVGIESRIRGLMERHPEGASAIAATEPLLEALEAEVAGAAGLSSDDFRRSLAASLDVLVLGSPASVDDVEQAWVERRRDGAR